MEIVMLAAGTSSRMGKVNKMLLPIGDNAMVAHCCLNALRFLECVGEKSKLIIVTGYRNLSLLKALKPCKLFMEQTTASITVVVVKNKNYRKGQFSSVKTGLREVSDGAKFIISLADMPDITKDHYNKLYKEQDDSDVIRPFVGSVPGHPVLFSPEMKKKILSKPDNCSVSTIIKDCKVKVLSFSDNSWIRDIDVIQDV